MVEASTCSRYLQISAETICSAYLHGICFLRLSTYGDIADGRVRKQRFSRRRNAFEHRPRRVSEAFIPRNSVKQEYTLDRLRPQDVFWISSISEPFW